MLLLLLAADASAQTTLRTYDCSSSGTNCPSPLPDPGPGVDAAALVSEMNVPTLCAADQFLTNIQPHIQLTHSFVGELSILLLTPGDARVDLIDRPLNGTGSCAGDDLNVTFNDGAPPFPCAAVPPSNGVPILAPVHFSLLDLAANYARPGTWRLQITDSAMGNSGALGDWSLTFTCDPKNVVTIAATDGEGDELGNPIVFTVTRSGVTTVPLNVYFSLAGTATSFVDYTPSTTVLTIPAGATSTTFTLTPRPDALLEATESVIASVEPSPNYVVGSPGSATASIADASAIPALSPWGLLLLVSGLALVAVKAMRG
jgi:subtilisin-like proprotein convertase family protein